MNGSDRLKIAVFIDFDNIEIGVKSTLNRHFDVGTVLEAIKERGEVVTKVVASSPLVLTENAIRAGVRREIR